MKVGFYHGGDGPNGSAIPKRLVCIRVWSKYSKHREGRVMMAPLYDGQQVGSAVDVRDRSGQSRTAAAERVFGRRKPYPEGALAGPIAPIRSRTIHACRNRKK